jgi:hypothetical protein
MYAKTIDVMRKAVAIAFLLCGAGLVVAARGHEWQMTVHPQAPGSWQSVAVGFWFGMLVCLAMAFVMFGEGVVRWWIGRPLKLKELFSAVGVSLIIYGAIIAALYLSPKTPHKGSPPPETAAPV